MKTEDLRGTFLAELSSYECAKQMRLKNVDDDAMWGVAYWSTRKLEEDVLPRSLSCMGGLMGEW